ncbi:hypothetical protein ACOI1H_24815, partial [Loktanella sp. DJP18]|uniref:hypothetical protein n=1 Tax=Loktanella sp. DJP18 TaxID=3409788 RepID=UPI003BB4A684
MITGLTFDLVAEENPLGNYMKVRATELKIPQIRIADALNVKPSAIAGIFSRTGGSPSFATPVAGTIMDMIIAAEQDQWPHMWQTDAWGGQKTYPAKRSALMRKAAFALSFWNRPTKASRSDPHREFRELLTMIDRDIYREMVRMLWYPFHGAIVRKSDVAQNLKAVAGKHGPSDLNRFRGVSYRQRDAVGDLLYGAEMTLSEAQALDLRKRLETTPQNTSAHALRRGWTQQQITHDEEDVLYNTEVIAIACSKAGINANDSRSD